VCRPQQPRLVLGEHAARRAQAGDQGIGRHTPILRDRRVGACGGRAAGTRAGAQPGYRGRMCRNIRTLHNFEPPATSNEVHAAALQYVRKVSGTSAPSQANNEAFQEAVAAVAHATQHLLDALTTSAPPKNREVEAAKARARAEARYS